MGKGLKPNSNSQGGRRVQSRKRINPLLKRFLIIGGCLLPFLFVGIMLWQPWVKPKPAVQVPAWLVFEENSNFTDEQKTQMVALAEKWVAKFPCKQKQVVISRMKVETSSQFITPERADRGRIAIDPDWSYYEFKWWDPFVHSLFHACAGDTRLPSKPLELEGIHIREFQGGKIIWARENDLVNPRPEIEEAAAEYLALAAVPMYHPSDDDKYVTGLANMRSSGMTPEEVWRYLSVSDMEGFAAHYYQIDPSQVDGSTFNDLMVAFFVKQ